MAKIFISHSSCDKEIIDLFKNKILNGGLGVADNDIAYTSAVETGVTIGDNIPQYIKDNIASCDFVFFMISENYRKSEVCLNEMGAAWALDKRVIPLLIEDIDFDSIGWLYSHNLGAKINDGEQLDSLRDELSNCSTQTKKTSVWNKCKADFLSSIGGGSGVLPLPKGGAGIDIVFATNNAKEFAIKPQYLYTSNYYKTMQQQAEALHKKVGLLDIQSLNMAFQPVSMPETTYNLAWCEVKLKITNIGSTVIDGFIVDLAIGNNDTTELDDDDATKSMTGIGSLKISREDEVFVNDDNNTIEYKPKRNKLVQGQSQSFSFWIQSRAEEIKFSWTLRAANYSKSGELNIVVLPKYEKKHEADYDINDIDPNETCIIEPKIAKEE